MKTIWTIAHIEKLKKEGKIVGYEEPKKPLPGGRKVGKHFKKRSKAKDFIGWNLLVWCQERGLVHEEEYVFAPPRKFAFDYAIEALKLAIEYEGLMSEKSGHTTVTGYTKDTEKYNLAQALGWKVIRFTALNYESLITELNKHV